MKENFESIHHKVFSKKIFFDTLQEAEDFLISNHLKNTIFHSNEWKFFLELDENDYEIFLQHHLNDLVFENARKFFDYIKKFTNQDSKHIWYFWDIHIENNWLEKQQCEKIISRLKNWIGFLFEDDFELDFEKPNKKQIWEFYKILKKIFWENFFVFVINTWIFSSHATKNIVLVPKHVKYYVKDFSDFLKLKQKENIDD